MHRHMGTPPNNKDTEETRLNLTLNPTPKRNHKPNLNSEPNPNS